MQTLLIDPVAFSIGSARVHWYGLILGLGALAGLLLAIREGSVLVFHKNFSWICSCLACLPQSLVLVFIM